MADAGSRRRSGRTRRIRYAEDSDDDYDASTPPRSQPARQSRLIQQERSYKEDSDETEEEDPDDDISEASSSEHASTQPVQRPQRKHATRSAQKRKRPVTRSTKRKTTFELFKKRKPNTNATDINVKAKIYVPHGLIPAWQTLPYHIMLNIMQYASYPLYGKASRSNPSIAWLLDTSLLCRTFHEACSAALLYSPPLYPSVRAHGLIDLLRKSPSQTSTNYRNLVKCLDLEVKNLLVRKHGINLEDMVSCTPLLQILRFYHNHDDLATLVWAHPSQMKGRRWSYPEDMAEMLDRHNIKLTSFEWNGRFPTPIDALNTMKAAHNHASFQSLREISFLNMTIVEKQIEADLPLFSGLLLDGIDNLTLLRSLTFRNCDMLTDAVMSRLPPKLTYLEVSNCTAFTSDSLASFLSSGGSWLQTLRLIGNQTMSLGFIHDLKSSCPRLQKLHIDLSYIDPTSYRDREPLYDELLPNGQPTWPSSLTSIDMEYLRQFSAEDAEGFFTSLVDAAPQLPHLKRLSINAIVKGASWRDRASLRQKWIPKLTNVFLSREEPKRWKLPVRSRKADAGPKQDDKVGRRSGRLQDIQTRMQDSEESDGPSPDSVSFDDNSNDRLGTCSVVELVLSDQRPAQDQYNENDFLDDEMSGDEDFRA